MQMPPWPLYEPDEIEAAAEVLKSGRVNAWTGDDCSRFEAAFAQRIGVDHALSMANGSLALEAALAGLGIGPGDDVLVTPRSFVASATCAVLRGARPVFADIDPDSQNVTAATLEAARTPATRAAVVVHLAGWPCDMPAIMTWAREHDIKVIEDCAQAHGASIAGHSVGAHGDVAAFSFCQDKIMSTGGDGGMLVTSDPALWRRAWSTREHGKSYDAVKRQDHPPGFRWFVESFGSNWRLTGPQAAIGLRQLAKLDDWNGKRTRNATILQDRLSAVDGIRCPWPGDDITHAWYRYYCFIEGDDQARSTRRDRIMQEINAAGWPCQVGGCPEIYLERSFVEAGFTPTAPLPVARQLAETSLAFLVHHTIDADTMNRYADAVAETISASVTA
ncbi:MAG: DegT/DnrJ/EryC1/StrS aminotransferase family protein [Phycisphaerales bacterium]|nr:DegT/DnrJ/EryC1/StrS aminotransferase family protein [Phycisphaerales bacterium]